MRGPRSEIFRSVRDVELDRVTLVLLRRPHDAADYPPERLDEIQQQHLAHLDAMREQGAMIVAGPFADQEDESLRGMCLYRTGLEETRALAERDPAVRAGRLAVDVLSWYHPKGDVDFSREVPAG
jgi:uncharacterized protein YciI